MPPPHYSTGSVFSTSTVVVSTVLVVAVPCPVLMARPRNVTVLVIKRMIPAICVSVRFTKPRRTSIGKRDCATEISAALVLSFHVNQPIVLTPLHVA
jgi:hypothetical protein